MTSEKSKKSLKFLNTIERIGNKLPEPLMIFVILIAAVIGLSTILDWAGMSVLHPQDGELLEIRSLLSGEGIEYMVTSLVDNFVGFAPLGVVLTLMIGIGLAERVGLLESLIKTLMLSVPAWLVPYMVFFTGNFATVASDAAFLIVPPLAGMIYYTLGRHPVAGIITGFVGASSGYGTGILITSNEPMLAGITNEAVAILGDGRMVTAVDNYFFMVVGVLIVTLIAGTITRKVTEPRLGTFEGTKTKEIKPVSSEEKRALKITGVVALLYVVIITTLALFPGSPLQNEDGGLVPSPFLDGIVSFLLVFFIIVGLTYGFSMKKISGTADVMRYSGEAIASVRNFVVIIFFIAQFTAFFDWTNIGLWMAVNGAEFLISVNLTGMVTIVGVILLSAKMTLLITSGSGLWAILAPIFVPMFMQLGYDPAVVQMAYRIGDSATGMITPLTPYMIVILGFIREWDKRIGIGSLISYTLPYSILILISSTLLLLGFAWLGIPIGPGVHF
ncbi:aminobenzoyl-glutamate transport protein [Geomicrobium sp. JCM 19037]|uniref:AbgT family transporter n=1 Tax=Geomicrobium sp. JCM 19037 TaxID=1460634 RepID=UPI00045F1087|nr:AbgT family transporter [Geomicrobium sp. JCM 19037]GAK02258.1 aminobenzoyl-glutamate transport protein [Geomicrobium sp. JCM 19037]